jgi:hypothetical protein
MTLLTHFSTFSTSLPVVAFVVGQKRTLREETPSSTEKISIKRFHLSEENAGDESMDGLNHSHEHPDSMNLKEFDRCLSEPLSCVADFKSRIQLVKRYFIKNTNHVTKTHQYDLWIELNLEKSLKVKIVFHKSVYHSTALDEQIFLEPTLKTHQKYYYFEVYEPTDIPEHFTKILSVRTSILGSSSELSWISKGKHLSGNQVFEIFYERIERIIAARQIFLYDDALLGFNKPGSNEEEGCFPSRIFRALGSIDSKGLSWYEGQGFSFTVCKDIPTIWKGETITQESEMSYRSAITDVRNTSLNDLCRLLKSFPTSQKTIKRLWNTHLPGQKWASISDLTQILYRESRIPEQKYQALKDFKSLYDHALVKWKPKGKTRESDQPFFKGIETLNDVCLFSKTQSVSEVV